MNLDKNEYDDYLKQKYKRKKSKEYKNEDRSEKRSSRKVKKSYFDEDDSEDDINFFLGTRLNKFIDKYKVLID